MVQALGPCKRRQDAGATRYCSTLLQMQDPWQDRTVHRRKEIKNGSSDFADY